MEGTLNIRKSDTEMFVREISKVRNIRRNFCIMRECRRFYMSGEHYRIHDDRQLQSSEPGQPVHTGVCRRFVMPGDSVKKECKY